MDYSLCPSLCSPGSYKGEARPARLLHFIDVSGSFSFGSLIQQQTIWLVTICHRPLDIRGINTINSHTSRENGQRSPQMNPEANMLGSCQLWTVCGNSGKVVLVTFRNSRRVGHSKNTAENRRQRAAGSNWLISIPLYSQVSETYRWGKKNQPWKGVFGSWKTAEHNVDWRSTLSEWIFELWEMELSSFLKTMHPKLSLSP